MIRDDTIATGSDPLLASYLEAADGAAADRALHALMQDHAGPVIERLLQQKNRLSKHDNPARGHSDDIASAARELLIGELIALRSGQRETAIMDFRAYAAGVAYFAWAQDLRHESPQRSMLLNRIRYLLENRTRQSGFALWQSASGRKWCGLSEWKNAGDPEVTPKLERIIADPGTAVREAFGDRYWQRNQLSTLVVDLFRWLERPIELRDLVLVVGELLEITDRTETLDAIEQNPADELWNAPQSSPADDLAWKEYLTWLWREIAALSAPQAAAFLLHSDVLRDFELLGLASIRTVAARIGMAAEELATIWQELPVGDLAIATHLHCARQQVINLRRVARDKLGAAWTSWLSKSERTGNNPVVSSSST
ncbi:MAG: hypothetical protein M3Z64_05875 [Verrucomicrobiota bacterium]|nr:hypothetical protein [Verrucomicrobiota bacterium]